MLLKSNFLLSSFLLAVPPKKPIIHDANGRKMTSTLGPYKVGEELIATCVTSAGKIEINVGARKVENLCTPIDYRDKNTK